MPPNTAATNAFRPRTIPISGSMLGCWMLVRIPAAPASADPRPNVNEITKLLFTPMSAQAVGLNASARIAMPIFVFRTMSVSTSRSTSVVPRTMTCPVVTVSAVKVPHDCGRSIATSSMTVGNARGFAPKRYWPKLSRNSETPIAVMSTVIFGRSRSGL